MNFAATMLDFAEVHRTRGNRICHAVGIPLITAAVLGALAQVPLFVLPLFSHDVAVDAAMVLLVGTLLLDLVWCPRLALGVVVTGVALLAVARLLPLSVDAVFFVVGWAFQLGGHSFYEKRRPAFVRNAVHFAVGPRWIVNRVLRVYPEQAAGESPQ